MTTYISLSARSMAPVSYSDDFYINPASLTVGGRHDSYDLECDHLGGRSDLVVKGCSPSVVWRNVPYWVTAEDGTVLVDENTSPQPRSCALTVQSSTGGNLVTVNISQSGRNADVKPTARINGVSYKDETGSFNAKAMRVHVDFEIENAKGREVRAYAVFCTADGTPLRDEQGNSVLKFSKAIPSYNSSAYDDMQIIVYYNAITRAANLGRAREALMYIGITTDEGRTWLSTSGPYQVRW